MLHAARLLHLNPGLDPPTVQSRPAHPLDPVTIAGLGPGHAAQPSGTLALPSPTTLTGELTDQRLDATWT